MCFLAYFFPHFVKWMGIIWPGLKQVTNCIYVPAHNVPEILFFEFHLGFYPFSLYNSQKNNCFANILIRWVDKGDKNFSCKINVVRLLAAGVKIVDGKFLIKNFFT